MAKILKVKVEKKWLKKPRCQLQLRQNKHGAGDGCKDGKTTRRGIRLKPGAEFTDPQRFLIGELIKLSVLNPLCTTLAVAKNKPPPDL